MSSAPDVIVVGGGAIGCGAAYYLARAGARVRLLDAGQIGHGCSYGNCGLICRSHVLPLTSPGAIGRVLRHMFDPDSALYVRPRLDPGLWDWLARFALHCRKSHMLVAAAARRELLNLSMNLYHDLIASEALEIEWDDRGTIFVYKTPREFHRFESSAEFLRRDFGLEMTPYPGKELTKLEPALRTDLAGGWYCPADSHLRPDRLMVELARVLVRLGVEIVEEVSVGGMEVSAGKLTSLVTSQGDMSAENFVFAAGAETARFARSLGCRIPIQPGKGYSITMPNRPEQPSIPLIFEESHVAVTPWPTGLRIGSTMEFVGFDRTINRRRIELFLRAAAEHLVTPPQGPIVEEWFGWRPMTYDELPCIGRTPRVANVIVAAGHGMLGISTMTGTGKLVCDLTLGQPPCVDPQPFALTRFGA